MTKSESSGQVAPLPIGEESGGGLRRPLRTLVFSDPDVEARYLQEVYDRDRSWVLGSVILGLLMTVGFYPIDRVFIDPEHITSVHAVRLLLLSPIALASIAIPLWMSRASLAGTAMFCLITLFGLAFNVLGWVAGPDAIGYWAFGITQTIMFVLVCLGLPFRRSMLSALIILVPFMAWSGRTGVTSVPFLYALATCTTVVMITAYGTLRYEWASRARFLAEHRLQSEYERRLAAEKDRSEWLGTIAGFVRHELKNAIAGVGSSLQLASRSSNPRNREIIGRAERSLQFMRSVLQQVGDATNLETALRHQDSEPLSISDLVTGRLQDFREQLPQVAIDAEVQPGLQVNGNADSLVQMLDKLVNNAIEHAAAPQQVTVTLRESAAWVQLEVSDRGDALPDDVERLFQPFVSTKAGLRDGNLGLGLYVAKVIVSHHAGEIVAEPLKDPPGAKFVVRLPAFLQGYAAGTA